MSTKDLKKVIALISALVILVSGFSIVAEPSSYDSQLDYAVQRIQQSLPQHDLSDLTLVAYIPAEELAMARSGIVTWSGALFPYGSRTQVSVDVAWGNVVGYSIGNTAPNIFVDWTFIKGGGILTIDFAHRIRPEFHSFFFVPLANGGLAVFDTMW